MKDLLPPTAKRLYVVRWVRKDGSCAKHRYYTRRHDAEAFRTKLYFGGWRARIYVTATEWQAEP